MDIFFSLIIPTFNSCQDLARILGSIVLLERELEGVEVIIVDDGSCDDTEDVFDRFKGQLKNLKYYYQKNKGPAAARNLGASRSIGQYLIFIDDDCLIPKGCLQAIKDFYKRNTNYDGLGVKTVNSSTSVFTEFNQRLGDYLIESSRVSDHQYKYVSSRCYSFTKGSYWALDGHDEGFIWPAAEDRDFCLKLRNKNMLMGYFQTIAVINTDDLRLKGFMRQNFLYGLGAGLFNQKNPDIPSAGLSRYKEMVFQICKGPHMIRSLALFLSFCLAQICTLAGLILYKINYDYKKRPPSAFLPRHVFFTEIIKNYLLGVPLIRSLKNCSGSLTTGEELFSAGYLARLAEKTTSIYKDAILKIFQDSNWLENKKVLEIGPGSHLAVPLSFIAAGAAKIISIDKFGEVKFRHKEQQVYEKIMSSMSDQQKTRVAHLLKEINLNTVSDLERSQLNYLADVPIDAPESIDRLPCESFDLIVSFNTLEHIKDLRIAFQNMRSLLKKGGIFIHRVDAGSHYAISRHTKNSLAQFIPSDRVFNWMFSNRDAPTRRLLKDYIEIAKDEKIPLIKFYTDESATPHEIKSCSGFLYSRYNNVMKDQISRVGFIIIAQKE